MLRINKALKNSGVTLLQLIMVMVLLGIIAITATPIISTLSSTRMNVTARKVQSDLRYAQELAMTWRQTHRVVFDTVNNRYTIYCVTCPGGPVIVKDPLKKNNFVVQLGTGEFTGVSISNANFGGSPQVDFTFLGTPNSEGTVTLSSSSGTKTITVTANTGKVS